MHELIPIKDATLIFSPFEDIQTSSLGIFLKTGSRYETKNIRGIAHFLEHLLFKGSKKYTHKKIKREIEGRGGSLNGFTSQEVTAYYTHFLNKNLKPTLDILVDMVFNPLLKKIDIEKERNVILEELKMYDDLPLPRASAILDGMLWPNHPLGEEVIGVVDTVKSIDRNDLAAFKNKHYLSANMVISCSGNIDRLQLTKLLEQRIKKVKVASSRAQTAPKPLKGLHIKAEGKSLQQTYLCMGFRGPSYRSNKIFTAQLLHIILGANMSSRLFEEVREKRGLCYDISTEVKKYNDSGALIVHLGLDKSRIEVALKAILRELQRIKDTLVSPKELERAKDYLLGQIVMRLERPQGRMFYMADNYISLKKIYTTDQIREKIYQINTPQVKALAKEILTFKDMCISCVGDVDNQRIEGKIRAICKQRR